MIEWLTRVAAWMSQTLNLFLLFGHHDQTVSSRAYVNRHRAGWRQTRKVINTVFFWQRDHCLHSYLSDLRYARQILSHQPKDEP